MRTSQNTSQNTTPNINLNTNSSVPQEVGDIDIDTASQSIELNDELMSPLFPSGTESPIKAEHSTLTTDDIADLANKSGLSEEEVEKLVDFYHIPAESVSADRTMCIGSFIRDHLDFLYEKVILVRVTEGES